MAAAWRSNPPCEAQLNADGMGSFFTAAALAREPWAARAARNVSRETLPPAHVSHRIPHPFDFAKIRKHNNDWTRKMYALALTAHHVPSVPHKAPTHPSVAPVGLFAHVVHTWQPQTPAGGWVSHVAKQLQQTHPQVPQHLWEPAITHILQHPNATAWGIPAGLTLPTPAGAWPSFFEAQTLHGLDDLGSFWSNPLGTIKKFVSHPATTIVHAVKKAAKNLSAKKIVATTKKVAPIAAGAAALYFGAPYLASALSSAGGAISGATGSVGSFITSEFPSLAGVGSTAAKWWASQGHTAEQYLSQLVSQPAVQTAASRAGISPQSLFGFLQQHAASVPPSAAAGGTPGVAAWMAQQAMGQQGIQMQSPAAVGLMNDRVASEQATMGASQSGTLPSNANQPNAAPLPPKKDWTKLALVGIGGAGLLLNATRGGS